jgi:hypothetical protein
LEEDEDESEKRVTTYLPCATVYKCDVKWILLKKLILKEGRRISDMREGLKKERGGRRRTTHNNFDAVYQCF